MGPTRVRGYNEEYLSIGFTYISDKGVIKPQCVICAKVLSAASMKRPNLQRHFTTEHPHLADKDRAFFERKRQNLNTQKLDITGGVHRQNAALLEASFTIAYQIAKKKKPHTIAEELVMPCMREVVRIVIGSDQAKLLSGVSVSDNTVQRRIVDLSGDIEKRVITEIKNSPFYAIASDESTDVASLSQLMVWVRYVFEDDFKDEPLFCSPLELTTTGADVFLKTQTYIDENGIGFDKLVGSCTDGAPAMLGVRSAFQTRLKEVAPQVKLTHCMLHRQALASKTLPQQMKDVLDQAVKIVNSVKKSPLNTRLLRKMCEDTDAEFSNLLYHTEVRWLSRGKVLVRLYDLRNEVHEFLTRVGKRELASHLSDDVWLANLCYLADIFERLNILNSSLQGRKPNVMDFHDKLRGFMDLLDLLVSRVRADRFTSFPRLNEFLEQNESIGRIPGIEEHLESLKSELVRYFPEVDPEKFDLVRNPFLVSSATLDDNEQAQEEFVKLKNDSAAQQLFNNRTLPNFWCSMRQDYPVLSSISVKTLLPYPSTYRCENSFSAMAVMKAPKSFGH